MLKQFWIDARTRFAALFGRRGLYERTDEEVRGHLAMLEDRIVASGVPRDIARAQARREFGNPMVIKEQVLDSWRYTFVDTLLQDIRHGFRTLLKRPTFALTIILVLAVAIGANTAVFSVVNSVLLQPLPYPDDGRIVRVGASTYTGGDRASSFSSRGYWHFVNNNRSFEHLGGYLTPDSSVLTGDGPALPVERCRISLSAFEALGMQPETGRLPFPEEDAPGGSPVALISHQLWVSRYGSDSAVLGRTITVSGTPLQVIGVMPGDFAFPSKETDVWIPFKLNPASENFGAHFISGIARLSPGVTVEAAANDARDLIARFGEIGYGPSWFDDIFDGGAIVRPLREEIVGDARAPLLIVFGTMAFVLFIACTNVANLLLVRAEERRQEYAVRLTLGASRARLARLMLMESGLLSLLGGAAGALVAYAGLRALVSIGPTSIPRLDEIAADGTAFAFLTIVSVLTGLLFGILPALMSSSVRTSAAIRDGGRGSTFGRSRHRVRNALVATQVALAFALVIGSGLMVRSFQALRSVEPGFSSDRVLTFQLQPSPARYADGDAVARLYQRLIGRLESIPGVTRAGAIDTLPLSGGGDGYVAVIEEFPLSQGELGPVFDTRRAAPGYFEAMGIPLIEGRTFTADDHARPLPSVIISNSVKVRYWPKESALNKGIVVAERVPARVIGVVGDVRDDSLEAPVGEVLYLPMVDAAGGDVDTMTITVRTAVDPLSLVGAIRGAIAEIDRDLPMMSIASMDSVLSDSMSRTSFTMSVVSIAALIALFLASTGIYGTLSYVVSQRTAEIGIRSALGARPGEVLRMILSGGLRLVGIGMLIGLAGALALGPLIVAQLYEVSPIDPITLAVTSAIFLVVAVLASLLPAARAASTAPVDALRAN